ncbi:MAG: helix-turn-helix transcriptional regulator [Clostridia bacterium]|nr:helix-turn-helix transcriptional regulator [Clostridia bacterium]
MAKKVGTLIKEARTEAGFTQEELARKLAGVSASDISKAERGQLELSQANLKKIAKACGVTQASLLNAAKGTSTKKTTTTKKTEKKTEKKTTTKKTSTAKKTSMQVTATERKLVEAYREATSDNKKRAMKILKDQDDSLAGSLSDVLGGLLG